MTLIQEKFNCAFALGQPLHQTKSSQQDGHSVSSTIPIGCQSTEISTIAPHSWLWLEKVPFTWQHLDILKLHFIFLQGDLF